MREVSPGDVIFSFRDTYICAIGIGLSNAREAPKPLEFGRAGAVWNEIGWRVEVRFHELHRGIRPIDHIARLRPYLQGRYSPLQLNGHGKQAVYLAEVQPLLATQLVDLIGTEARAIVQTWRAASSLDAAVLGSLGEWEEHQVNEVKADTKISETEKESIVLSRRGQGVFRARVAKIETRCRVTGATNPEYLRASHTNPWRDANNAERLDGENGLLLSPDVDLLFDRGFISFENGGKVLVSPVADMLTIEKLGIRPEMLKNVGAFSAGQRDYLAFHRAAVFLEARLKRQKTKPAV